MLKTSRRVIAVAILAATISSTPAFAASRNDDSPILRRVTQIIRLIKHFFPTIPTDEPLPPKP